MSEMVERVARAIAEGWEGGWDDPDHRERFKADARAAIAAMREPTDEMRHAGWIAGDAASENVRASETWQAMIDAALAESDPPHIIAAPNRLC